MYREVSIQKIESLIGESHKIGQGRFGTVYKVSLDGVVVAIKKAHVSTDKMTKINREINIMKSVKHTNIVDYISSLVAKSEYYLILEFMEGPTLKDLIHSRVNMANGESVHKHTYTEDDGIKLLAQAAKALAYLHGMRPNQIIHRDVKPCNMLLDKHKKILKLCDFGNTRECGSFMSGKSGTIVYMAPEVCNGNRYSEKCDVYSLAITCWEVISRKQPYIDEPQSSTFKFVDRVTNDRLRPSTLNLKCPQHIKDLMEKCWSPVPANRWTMDDIVNTLEGKNVDNKD